MTQRTAPRNESPATPATTTTPATAGKNADTAPTAPAVTASGLEVVFRRSHQEPIVALRNLHLTVYPGEVVAIIGPSGAGKTTLLRCLTGFVRPDAGELVVEGTDARRASRRELNALRRRVATVYQHFNLVERVSALGNVLHGRLGHIRTLRGVLGIYPHADRLLAYRTLAAVGLADRALTRVDRLSGGERQRVAIARALVQLPRIVLADEPAASLDLSLTETVLEALVERRRRDGLTAIVSMHDIGLAKEYATRIVGLRAGTNVFDGSPSDLTDEALEAIYGSRSNGRR